MKHFLSRDTHTLAQRHIQGGRVIIRHMRAHPIRGGAVERRQFHTSAHHISAGGAFRAAIHIGFKLRRVQHFKLKPEWIAALMQADQGFTIPRHTQHHQAAHIQPGMPARYVTNPAPRPLPKPRFNTLIGVFILAGAAIIHHLHLQREALGPHHVAAQAFQKARRITFILRQPARTVAQRIQLPADIAIWRETMPAWQIRQKARRLRCHPTTLRTLLWPNWGPCRLGARTAQNGRGAFAAAEKIQQRHIKPFPCVSAQSADAGGQKPTQRLPLRGVLRRRNNLSGSAIRGLGCGRFPDLQS